MIRSTWISRLWFLFILLCAGCSNPKPTDLLGLWQAGPAETEWGTATIEINFKTTSDIEVKWLPAEGGDALVINGKYRLSGNQLISDVFNKGMPVTLRMKDDQLSFELPSEPNEKFHFSRK